MWAWSLSDFWSIHRLLRLLSSVCSLQPKPARTVCVCCCRLSVWSRFTSAETYWIMVDTLESCVTPGGGRVVGGNVALPCLKTHKFQRDSLPQWQTLQRAFCLQQSQHNMSCMVTVNSQAAPTRCQDREEQRNCYRNSSETCLLIPERQ